jgi:hypothetical protein
MIDLKKIAAGAMIAGTLGFTALGLGSGVANASPTLPGIPWQQDGGWWWGHGHGHGHWHGGDGWGWGGPGWGWGGGPGWGWGGGWGGGGICVGICI